jgi:hypothetical protein
MRPYPPLTEALRNAVTRGVQVTAIIETLQGAGQRNHCGARRNCPGSRCGDMAAFKRNRNSCGHRPWSVHCGHAILFHAAVRGIGLLAG